MPAESLGFRRLSLTGADEALLRRWLSAPHVRRYWGEPERELDLIRQGEKTGESEGWIVTLDEEPVAYIQAWLLSAEDEPWVTNEPPGARGIDLFIGPEDLLGKGLGRRILRAFTDRLQDAGATRIIIDPDAENIRAQRAFAAAGFHEYDRFTDTRGHTFILMELPPRQRPEDQ
jgi:aminoglycoside 6'-N-acetyltransferase